MPVVFVRATALQNIGLAKHGFRSGTTKDHKPKPLSPDIFRKGWGPKSSVCPSKSGKSNVLGGISGLIAGISRRCPKSLIKKVCVQFWAPIINARFTRINQNADPSSTLVLLHVCPPPSYKVVTQGCEDGVFGKRYFCPLPKTGGFDEKWRK